MNIHLAIFASGSGTNAEKIMEYFQFHESIRVSCLLSNNKNAGALERAEKFNVPTYYLENKDFLNDQVLDILLKHDVSYVSLAGFLRKIGPNLLEHYEGKIINIHPALLPNYGGKGSYGMKVHEAVKRAGDTKTGISIHIVDEQYDHGDLIFQKSTELKSADTVVDIANKVHELEHEYYPKIIESFIKKREQIA